MRTFTEKPKATQQTAAFTQSSIPNRIHVGQSHEMNLGPGARRAIQSQAVQRTIKSHIGRPEGGSTGVVASRFAYDFSRIPIHAPGVGATQDMPANMYDVGQSVHKAAEYGTSGSGGSLPHLTEIQRAFGHHEVSDIRAHEGSRATSTARAIGARAYTLGNHVVFADTPNLHTAAHVVQQRRGVQLLGGVGQAGDAYERHADAVADLVVRGNQAGTLLDQMPLSGGGHGAATTGGVKKAGQALQMQGGYKPPQPKQATEDPTAALLLKSLQNMLKKRELMEKVNGAIAHELASAYLKARKPRIIDTPFGPKDLNLTVQASHAEVYDAILTAMDVTETKAKNATAWKWTQAPAPPKGGTRDKADVEIQNWVTDQLIDAGKDKLLDTGIEEAAFSCAARWSAAEGLVVVAEMVVGALSVYGWISLATSVLELMIVLQKPVEEMSKRDLIVADVKNWLGFGPMVAELAKARREAEAKRKSLGQYSEDKTNPLAPIYTRVIH